MVLPSFQRQTVKVQGRVVEYYMRDALKCIKALYGSPQWAEHLLVVPERHYSDPELSTRLYSDMNTGDLWWALQEELQLRPNTEGATVIPVLVASDKTLLTQFRNKSAYPVYITIGNIPKDIRKKPSQYAQILVGYLPTDRLDHIDVKARRTLATHEVIHGCFQRILRSLNTAGFHGVMLAGGDGQVRRCFPILAGLVVDYPEQALLTGVKYGRCMTCKVNKNDLGSLLANDQRPADRNPDEALLVWRILGQNPDWNAYRDACNRIGMKPLRRPFWVDLPFVNIFRCITPDVLHQLL